MPDASVTVSRLRFVLVFVAVTFTFGTSPPLASWTTPVIVAVGTCADTNP